MNPHRTRLIRLNAAERARLQQHIGPYLRDCRVQSMSAFTQHGSVSTLSHCTSVAETAWWLTAHLPARSRARVNEHALAVGALLHDFYLYDWHGAGWQHSYQHAHIACKNAIRHFNVDAPTQHVIRSHMWPIGITHVPHTREAVLVTIADKMVSLHETLFLRKHA